MKSILGCFLVCAILSSSQGLDLPFGFGKRVLDPLPPSQVVRLFGFPTHGTSLIERQLGELLAAACRSYAKAASCKLHSVPVAAQHLRVLEFQSKEDRSVVAYVAHDEMREAGQALIRCSEADQKNATKESGTNYHCFAQTDLLLQPLESFLGEAYPRLQRLGLEDLVLNAPRKAVFIATDPAVMVAIHALQKSNVDGMLDAALAQTRTDFRIVVQWLSWQHQQFRLASSGNAMLMVHTCDFNNSAEAVHRQLLQFFEVPINFAELQKLLMAKDRNGDDQAAGIASVIPRGIASEIDAFVREAVQDPEMLAKYASTIDAAHPPVPRRAKWPNPDHLQKIAIDNSLIITAVDCAGVELAINWVASLNRNWVPCYMVIAMDEAAYNALLPHMPGPEWLTLAPPHMRVADVTEYVGGDSKDFRRILEMHPQYLKAILDQGYNVAWSDVDVVWYSNVFTRFDKAHEFMTVPNGDGAPDLGYLSHSGERFIERHPVSTSFFFLRPTNLVYKLLNIWGQHLAKPHSKGDQGAFSKALRGELSKAMDIAVLPSAAFPSAKQTLLANGTEPETETRQAFEAAWKAEPAAWLHAGSAQGLQAKKVLLQAYSQWFVPADYVPITCVAPTAI